MPLSLTVELVMFNAGHGVVSAVSGAIAGPEHVQSDSGAAVSALSSVPAELDTASVDHGVASRVDAVWNSRDRWLTHGRWAMSTLWHRPRAHSDVIFLPNRDFIVATWNPGRIGYFKRL